MTIWLVRQALVHSLLPNSFRARSIALFTGWVFKTFWSHRISPSWDNFFKLLFQLLLKTNKAPRIVAFEHFLDTPKRAKIRRFLLKMFPKWSLFQIEILSMKWRAAWIQEASELQVSATRSLKPLLVSHAARKWKGLLPDLFLSSLLKRTNTGLWSEATFGRCNTLLSVKWANHSSLHTALSRRLIREPTPNYESIC